MANANTFAAAVNVPAPKQLIASTATDAALLDVNGNALTVGLANNQNFDNAHTFSVRIRGIVTTGTTSTFTVKLWLGSTAAAVTGSPVVAFTVSSSLVSTSGHFDLAANMQWDSATKIVDGFTTGHAGAALTTAVPSATNIASVNSLDFVASAQFSAGNAANAVTVTEFTINQQ